MERMGSYKWNHKIQIAAIKTKDISKKGQIWFLGEFTLGDNNEIGNHPVIIVSNDDINNTSSSVTVVPMTSKSKPPMKTNVIF